MTKTDKELSAAYFDVLAGDEEIELLSRAICDSESSRKVFAEEQRHRTFRPMDKSEQKAFLKTIGKIEERRSRRLRRRIISASSVSAILLVAAFIFIPSSKDVRPSQTEFRSFDGGSCIVTLPDLSTVRLIGDASLVESSDFSAENRKVKFDGEAVFDITSDAQHPFEVLTGNGCKVKVYGTQFNLDAPEDAGELTLTLLKGKVSFEGPDVRCEVAPGETIRYDGETGSLSKATVNIDDYRLWMEGNVELDNVTVENLAQRLEGIFGVRIILPEDLRTSAKTFSVSIRNREDLQSVLDATGILLGVSYSCEDGTVRIHSIQ